MARAGQSKSRGADLADRIAVAVLAGLFPPEAVTAVLKDCGALEQRSRRLTAELTTYYVLGCVLWHQYSYEVVWEKLVDGLSWLNYLAPQDTAAPASSSISEAKQRLGSEPFRVLVHHAAGSITDTQQRRGRRQLTVGALTLNTQETKANRRWLAEPAKAPTGRMFPQVRAVVLAESGTGVIRAARVGAPTVPPAIPFRDLIEDEAIGPETIVIVDVVSLEFSDYASALRAGANLVWRVPADRDLPVARLLPDGSWISQLHPPAADHGDPISVRVVGFGADEFLVTSILDHDEVGAPELSGIYVGRWTPDRLLSRTGLKADGPAGTVLRSKKPDGVIQEMWAVLAVYQALCHLRINI